MRVLFALLMCLTAVLAAPQGGGMGGGGGFGGGGVQGGRAEFSDDSEIFRKQLFLSPGDRTEWIFEVKENEALLVKVTSAVFDPAVAIHDDKGVKLVENDDIEPGNQMAQLIYKLPKPGKYTAVVTNYKGTAGGQFEFYVQRFQAVDLKMKQPVTLDIGGKRAWGRVDIDKPGDYVVTLRSSSGTPAFDLHGPNGEEVNDMQAIDNGGPYQRWRLVATQKGSYFVRPRGGEKPVARVTPVLPHEAKMGSTASATLDEDEVHDWTFNAKKNDLFEISLVGNPSDIAIDAETPASMDDSRLRYQVLKGPTGFKRYAIAVINDGPITFSVRDLKGASGPYQLRLAPIGKPWPSAETLTSSLDWFETEFWTVEAKTGDVLKLRGTSSIFTTQVALMDPNGRLIHAATVGLTPDVALTLPVQITGRYVVVVTGGGVGEYHLAKEVVLPRKIAEGVTTGDLRGTPDVWRFSARKGQDFAFRIASRPFTGQSRSLARTESR